jgi:hypothetical protein
MDFGKLTPEQKATARMIADEARANNVDPELALAIGFRENRFLNRVNPDSGAMGVMQVMPANAAPLGMKVEDLNDPNMNIIAGVRILKENLDRYKGNAKLAAIAYNSRPVVADRFAKNGDESLLPKETQNYWREVNNFRDLSVNGYLPAQADAEQAQDQTQQSGVDLGGKAQPLDKPLERSNLGDKYDALRYAISDPEGGVDKPLMTLGGAGVGVVAGAAETGGRTLNKINQTLNASREAAEANRLAAEASQAMSEGVDPNSPGQKYKRKTGYGRGTGYTTEEVITNRERAKGHGEVSKKLSARYGVPEAGESILDMMLRKKKEGEILAAEALKQERAAAEAAKRANMISKTGALARIPIIGPAIAGGSMGYDIADLIERYEKGDRSGAVIQGIGALGSGLAMVPHPLTRAAGTVMGAGAIPAVMLNDYLKSRGSKE